MESLNKPPSLYLFFRLLILIKIQTFVNYFSGGFQNPFSLWIQGTLVDLRLFSEANMFCFLFSKVDVFCSLMFPHLTSYTRFCIIVPIHDTLLRKTKKWLTNMNLIKPVRQVYLLYRKLLGALIDLNLREVYVNIILIPPR